MKRIIGIVVLEANVPEDMDLDEVRTAFIESADSSFDCLRIRVQGYPNEDEAEPLFEFKQASAGARMVLNVDGIVSIMT